MSKTKKAPKQVTDAQIKSAYALWQQGGMSVWKVKKATGILARILVPAFEKLSGKKLKSPAAKADVGKKSTTGKKSGTAKDAKGKEGAEPTAKRRAAA